MLTVLGGIFESVRCAVSQVPASVKKVDDFCWAWEPQLGDFSSQYMVLGSMAVFVVEIYLAPKCDVLDLTAFCCGPNYEFKADLDFSPYQAKGEAVLGVKCVQCPWPSELR